MKFLLIIIFIFTSRIIFSDTLFYNGTHLFKDNGNYLETLEYEKIILEELTFSQLNLSKNIISSKNIFQFDNNNYFINLYRLPQKLIYTSNSRVNESIELLDFDHSSNNFIDKDVLNFEFKNINNKNLIYKNSKIISKNYKYFLNKNNDLVYSQDSLYDVLQHKLDYIIKNNNSFIVNFNHDLIFEKINFNVLINGEPDTIFSDQIDFIQIDIDNERKSVFFSFERFIKNYDLYNKNVVIKEIIYFFDKSDKEFSYNIDDQIFFQLYEIDRISSIVLNKNQNLVYKIDYNNNNIVILFLENTDFLSLPKSYVSLNKENKKEESVFVIPKNSSVSGTQLLKFLRSNYNQNAKLIINAKNIYYDYVTIVNKENTPKLSKIFFLFFNSLLFLLFFFFIINLTIFLVYKNQNIKFFNIKTHFSFTIISMLIISSLFLVTKSFYFIYIFNNIFGLLFFILFYYANLLSFSELKFDKGVINWQKKYL